MTQKRNSEREGLKFPSRTLATLARPGRQAKLAEGLRRRAESDRQPTTTWQLLIWTYQRQKAHLEVSRVGAAGHARISSTGTVLERLRLGVSIDCGRRRGAPPVVRCDVDALAVHGYVTRLGHHAQCLIETAATGSAPDWQPYVPPLRCGPVLRGNGKPKMIYESNRPVACVLAYDGFRPDRAADVARFGRDSYTRWWAALSLLHGALAEEQSLKRWLVASIGALAEPWNEPKRDRVSFS